MDIKDWIKKKNTIFTLYSFLFLVVCFISFSPFILRGNSLVPNADGYNEAFPVFVYCRDFWMDTLRGNIQTYDFSIGLGDDVIFTLNYPGLFDIFSIASALLFPKKYIEAAYCFSIIVKLYFAGMSFILFTKRYVSSKYYLIIGALLYSFNIYELFWGMNWAPFLLAPITFPIILYGIDELLEQDRKLSFSMIIALFIQGINGFYLLYIECVLAIFYFLVVSYFRLYKREKNNLKFIICKMLNIAYNGLVGVLLSGVILLPTIVSLFSSTREMGGEVFSTQLFCEMDKFISGIGNLFIPDVYDTVSTLPVFAVGGMISYMFIKNARKEFRYMALVFWFLMWCPCWGSIMNGFSYSTDRWIFAVALFGNLSTVLALDSKEKMPVTARNIFIILAVISIVIHTIQSEKNIGLIIRILVFAGLAISFICVWNMDKRREYIILILGTITATCMGLFTFGPKMVGGCGYSANFKQIGIYNEIRDSVAGIEKQGSEFERWDVYDSSLGASLVGKYYGTSEYFSMMNAYVSEFYQEMFISPGIKVSSFCLRGLDGRQEIESLLSVSKYMDFITNNSGDSTPFIKDNEYFIPFGFTYDSYILREEFDKLNPMHKSGQILNTIVLEEEYTNYKKESIQEAKYESISFEAEAVDEAEYLRIYLNEEDFNKVYEEQKNEIYVSCHGLQGDGYFYVGNKEIEMKAPDNIYYTGIDEFWVNVSEIKKDSKGCYFEIKFDGISNFDITKMNVYYHEIDFAAISERQKNTLKNLQILTNQVKGEISCRKDELLFLSIPYSVGWSAYVDGEEIDIMKANIGFMAIPLEEGTHEIELLYETPGLKLGAMCSLVALLIVIINVVYIKKKKGNGEIL